MQRSFLTSQGNKLSDKEVDWTGVGQTVCSGAAVRVHVSEFSLSWHTDWIPSQESDTPQRTGTPGKKGGTEH